MIDLAQGPELEVLRDPIAKPVFEPLSRMIVEPGSKEDWDLLHHLHYKTEGRPVGANYWRLALDGETIGVTVLTLPRPLLKERHAAFPDLKPGGDTTASNRMRYAMINRDVRVIGRIVLDTMFRGVGAAYRFQNLVSRLSGFRYVEIQSAMSKYNNFASRAGFLMSKPMRSNKYEVGIKFFAETFRTNPADTVGLIAELDGLHPVIRDRRVQSIREFYYRHSALEKTGSARARGKDRVQTMPVDELIRQLQQMILASPLWGIYQNPDHGRKDLPERLPLLAFDRQKTNERLIT